MNVTSENDDKVQESKLTNERKRIYNILSGNIEPIKTNFNLQIGEHAYLELETERYADTDLIESYTTGTTKRKGTVKRAIVGDLLFGRTGAVIGGLSGKSETQYQTTQERVTRSELVDKGRMLFTNKRLLYIGKVILAIPYGDILSASFTDTDMEVKYPSMLKGEYFSLSYGNDAEYYYHGLQRLIGKDKSKVNEDDIILKPSSLPSYVSPRRLMKQRINLTAQIIIMLILIYPIGLVFMWKSSNWNSVVKWVITSFFALITLFIVIGATTSSSNPSSTQASNKTSVPMQKAKQTKTGDSPEIAKYKAQMKPLIQQFEAEESVLNGDKSTLPHQDDPVYQHTGIVYADLNKQLLNSPGAPPVPFNNGYSTFLANIFDVMASSTYDLVHPDTSSGTPQFNHYAVIGLKTAEDDMKIAEKMQPTYPSKYVDTYSGYGSMISDLMSLSQQVAQ